MDKKYQFLEAATLLKIINDNKDLLRTEIIKGIYTSGRQEWFEHRPGKKTWTIDSCMIIEFDSFAVGIDYYDSSNMTIRTTDQKDIMHPIEKIKDFDRINSPISRVMIERFSNEFEISPSGDMVRPEGGDYFRAVIIMSGNIGIRICPEDIEFDSTYFDVEIVNQQELKEMEPIEGGYYEDIEI